MFKFLMSWYTSERKKVGDKKRCPFDRRGRGGQRIDSVGSTVRYEVIKIRAVDRILKSRIKSDKSDYPIFKQVKSPCSCGHFKMRLTYVGPLVPEL